MQIAPQTAFKDQKPPRSRKSDTRDVRAKTIAAIHITWAKLRRDLKGDKDELRESRLAFMSQVLNREVKSSRDLTPSKLGKVLDAMREIERAPLLPGAELRGSSPTVKEGSAEAGALANERATAPAPAEIYHLATQAQVAAIDKLFEHLRWRAEGIEKFLVKRFNRASHRLVTPKQANAVTMILLTIAASRAIKERSDIERVSRAMIRMEIPAIKRKLGIDQANRGIGEQGNVEEDGDLEVLG